MKLQNEKRDISAAMEKVFQQVREDLIKEEKKKNGYLVIAGKDRVVKKVLAKDL